MRLAAILLAVLFATACKNSETKKTGTVSAGLQEKMVGQWTDGTTQNATFDISKDSIHYIDLMNHHKYEVVPGDSISIQYPYYTYLGKISFSGDTLLIADGNGVGRFWKYSPPAH